MDRNKYEAMVIVKAGMPEKEEQALFDSINEVINKNNGEVNQSSVWSDRRKLAYPLKKHLEGTYYLVNFNSDSESIKEINRSYKLNENILRVLITRQ